MKAIQKNKLDQELNFKKLCRLSNLDLLFDYRQKSISFICIRLSVSLTIMVNLLLINCHLFKTLSIISMINFLAIVIEFWN